MSITYLQMPIGPLDPENWDETIPDSILGCNGDDTSACAGVGNIVRTVAVGIGCTLGKVIDFPQQLCEIIKIAAQWLNDNFGWNIPVDKIHCPTSIRCDKIKDSCLLKRFSCKLMGLRKVCWDDLGCGQ